MVKMTCPVCGQRKAKRTCPALGRVICTVCCGTKRLVEIRCPETCGYLATAREHPPVVVQRRQQQDVAVLVGAMDGLSDGQRELVLVLLGVVRSRAGDPLQSLRDEDVADAASALAATFETAERGVIYEHPAASLPAQRLVGELRAVLDEIGTKVQRRQIERDAPYALRAVERGARRAGTALGGGPTAYVDLVGRLLRAPGAGAAASPVGTAEAGGSGLILPPD
jgi:hypothetical protein